jgi:hypothetical protein
MWQPWYHTVITTVIFVGHLAIWYNNGFLQLFRHLFFISDRINDLSIHYVMGVLNVTAVHTAFWHQVHRGYLWTATTQGLPKIMLGFQPAPQEQKQVWKYGQNFNPVFEFDMNVDMSMVWDHLMTKALGNGTRNLEGLAVWEKRHSTG